MIEFILGTIVGGVVVFGLINLGFYLLGSDEQEEYEDDDYGF